MAWTIVGVSTSVEVAATSHVLTVPASVAQGDLLVACISSRIASTTSVTLPTGGEWTLVAEVKNNNVTANQNGLPSGLMAYCVRGASNPNLTFTHPVAPSVALGRIVAYRGGVSASANAKDTQTSFQTALNVTAVSGAGLTTTALNDLVVALAAGGQEAAWSSFNATTPAGASGAADTTTAPSATWRERADQVTTTGADTSLGVFDALKTVNGATGNLTATGSVAAGQVVIAGAFRLKEQAGAGAAAGTTTAANAGGAFTTLSPADGAASATGAAAAQSISEITGTAVASGTAEGAGDALILAQGTGAGSTSALAVGETVTIVAADGAAASSASATANGMALVEGQGTGDAGGTVAIAFGLAESGAYGTAISSSAADASGDAAVLGEGTAAGVGTGQGEGSALALIDGVGAGTSSATAAATALVLTEGIGAGASSVTAAATALVLTEGIGAGVSGVTADASALALFDGVGAGISSATADAAALAFLDGVGAGASSVTAVATALVFTDGVGAGISSTTAAATAVVRTEGIGAGASSVTADAGGGFFFGELDTVVEAVGTVGSPPLRIYGTPVLTATEDAAYAGFTVSATGGEAANPAALYLGDDVLALDGVMLVLSSVSIVIGVGASTAASAGSATATAIASANADRIIQKGTVIQVPSTTPVSMGTVSSTITVPDDAELVIVGISGYHGLSGGFEGATFTRDGVDTPMVKGSGGDTSTAGWQSAMFWLASPDIGSGKTLKFSWNGESADPVQNFSVTFWHDVDLDDPVRDSGGAQGSVFPVTTAPLTVEPTDLIVAFSGFFNSAEDGSGSITTWSNLVELEEIPNNAYAEGAWATGRLSGGGALLRAPITVGPQSATNAQQAGVNAAVLKQKRKGLVESVGTGLSLARAIGESITNAIFDVPGAATGTAVATAAGTVIRSGQGVAIASATVSVSSQSLAGAQGSATGTTTAVAYPEGGLTIGAAAGTSTVSGSGRAIAPAGGAATGTSTVTAIGGAVVPVIAYSVGAATAEAASQTINAAAAVAAGIATVAAASFVDVALADGLAAGTASVAGVGYRLADISAISVPERTQPVAAEVRSAATATETRSASAATELRSAGVAAEIRSATVSAFAPVASTAVEDRLELVPLAA